MRSLPALTVFALLLATAQAQAATPLVDAPWLAGHSCADGVAVIDIRDDQRGFARAHVPCAVAAPYRKAGWRIKAGGVPGMLPDPEALAALIGGLGVGNGDHVVIVARGGSAAAMAPATRVYWTFKVAGHDAVSILDGGMAAYLADRDNPIATGATTPARADFRVALRPELIATAADVAAAIESGTRLVDNREPDVHMGINKSPIVARPGAIPGARNLPVSWLTRRDGRFHTPEALRAIAAATGFDDRATEIDFCNTGQKASLGWFVSHELLGDKKARLYDGSMAEWAADPSRPVDRKIVLP